VYFLKVCFGPFKCTPAVLFIVEFLQVLALLLIKGGGGLDNDDVIDAAAFVIK
jgi:hypothetical protein